MDGASPISVEDVSDEIFDMAKPDDPLCITLDDLVSSKVGHTIVSISASIININTPTMLCIPRAYPQHTRILVCWSCLAAVLSSLGYVSYCWAK